MERILIADDHPIVRGALLLAVEAAFGRAEISESASLDELFAQLEQFGAADLILLDLRMPGVNGFSGLQKLRSSYPEAPVVVVSALEDKRLVDEALALGAVGFIPKSTPRHKIIAALRKVAAGEIYVPPNLESPSEFGNTAVAETELAHRLSTLTAQQTRVLYLLGTGKLNKQIAYELDIAEPTVKVHVSAILHKLKVHSRTQAVVLASKLLSNSLTAEQERWPSSPRQPTA